MIPLSEPLFQGNEWKYLQECLDSGWVSAAGPLTSKLEAHISKRLNSREVIAVSSGTSALHLSLLAAGVSFGDLVLVSDYSFIASANVIRYVGADPIFMEVHPDTWQANPIALEEWLEAHCRMQDQHCIHIPSGRKISAMILVHAYGQMADIYAFQKIAHQWGIRMIEDAAGAIGSRLKGEHAGRIAEFGSISLNGNKLITAGGGGLVLCQNSEKGNYIRHISRQAKAEGTTYQHTEVGYNYRLPDLMAALALAQFEVLNEYLVRKKSIAIRYFEAFPEFDWQQIIPDSDSNYWMIAFRTKHKEAMISKLQAQGIQAKEGWYPLHLQTPFQGCLFAGNPKFSKEIYNEVVCLPSSVGLKESEIETVGKIVHDFLNQ